MEPSSFESGEVIPVEQVAVSRTAWEEGVLKAEVSHHHHGVGLLVLGSMSGPQ